MKNHTPVSRLTIAGLAFALGVMPRYFGANQFDYLVEVAKRPGYKSGDTLRLILPFLKAQGLTNARIEAYSRQNVTLLPGAEGAFKFLHSRGFPIFEISTSYRPFAEAVGLRLGFKKERIFSTALDLDRYSLSPAEGEELKRLQGEIVAAPAIEFPADAAAADADFQPAKVRIEGDTILVTSDTLGSIARRFNTTVAELMRLNSIANPATHSSQPTTKAEPGAITPVGIGRWAVRRMSASTSLSIHMFRAATPPAQAAVPSASQKTRIASQNGPAATHHISCLLRTARSGP